MPADTTPTTPRETMLAPGEMMVEVLLSTDHSTDAIRARHDAATATVDALCAGRRWTMTVPADPSRDPDLVISAALADIPRLLAERDRLAARIAAANERAELAAQIRAAAGKPADAITRPSDPRYQLHALVRDAIARAIPNPPLFSQAAAMTRAALAVVADWLAPTPADTTQDGDTADER